MQTLTIQDFIKTKQESRTHTKEEVVFFIKNLQSFSDEEIIQWLRAVKSNGLTTEETSALTLAMAQSGVMLSWEELESTLDKHSTGGIGDKVSLLFVPLVVSYGEIYLKRKIYIPKLSGRALGITGGTIDKLESIPQLKTNLSLEQIKEQIKNISCVICSTSSDLAPADKKLYALRDITGTIDSIPLIASSIMSKKIAGGAKNIILDVKFGSGAFMKSFQDAKNLAVAMVNIGKDLDKNIRAVISNMDQPLGRAVGNTLEIKEVIDILSSTEVNDLSELVICLAKEAIEILDKGQSSSIKNNLRTLLKNGDALKVFKEMIKAQGGNLEAFSQLKKANIIEVVRSDTAGYIQNIGALTVGETVYNLGAGRKQVSDQIDHTVGIVFMKKYGDKVLKQDTLFEIHARSKQEFEVAKKKLLSAISFSQKEPPRLKLVYEVVK